MAPSSESSSQTSAAASSPENAPPSASAPQTGAGEGCHVEELDAPGFCFPLDIQITARVAE